MNMANTLFYNDVLVMIVVCDTQIDRKNKI
jgi:hypothetical protein